MIRVAALCLLLAACASASPYTQAPVKDEPQCGADWNAPTPTLGATVCKILVKGFFYGAL